MTEFSEETRTEYENFISGYEELLAIGEEFMQKQLFRGVKIEKYIQLKDRLVFYVFDHYPELYDQYFVNEPQLPKLSMWYYILHSVFWVSDKLLNRIWWPKYGTQVVEYMSYYNHKLKEAVGEIEKANQ